MMDQEDGRADGRGWETLVVRGRGASPDPAYHAHRTPVYQTSTFVFDSPEQAERRFLGEEEGYIYSRLSNPTVHAVEERIAAMEGAEAGLAFASGLGAVAALVLSQTVPGDNLVLQQPIYGGTVGLLKRLAAHTGVELRYLPARQLPARLDEMVDDRTRMVLLEIPANPTLEVVDLEAVAECTRDRGILLAVDSTFATPYHLRPLKHGADVVIHSATKYLGGHGDLIAGLLAGSRALMDEIFEMAYTLGATLAPWNAYLLLRGMRTLHVRMPRHAENAQKVAEYLAAHPEVVSVYYPGLSDSPDHGVAAKLFSNGYGGMVSFVIRGGKEAAMIFQRHLRLWLISVSLGDGDSLITHPASTTHAKLAPEELETAGIHPGLLRLSVGLENAEDLIADLDQAFQAVKRITA
jgi:methionine-gamma-lyase